MASISGWTETIMFSLLFVITLGVVIVQMNVDYGENYILPFSDDSGAQQLFIEYQDTAQTQIEGGEVQFDAEQGITLKSSWGLVKDIITIIWRFITGGWIESIIAPLQLGIVGAALAVTLRVLFFVSVILSIIYILFKVVP